MNFSLFDTSTKKKRLDFSGQIFTDGRERPSRFLWQPATLAIVSHISSLLHLPYMHGFSSAQDRTNPTTFTAQACQDPKSSQFDANPLRQSFLGCRDRSQSRPQVSLRRRVGALQGRPGPGGRGPGHPDGAPGRPARARGVRRAPAGVRARAGSVGGPPGARSGGEER